MKSENGNIAGLILAAGRSSRMKMFKPLLQLNNKSFLSTVVNKLDFICDEIIVVTGYNKYLIEEEINLLNNKKVRTVFNEQFNMGMFTSLQVGIRELASYNWVLYHFVDQPLLPELFYGEFIKQRNSDYDWIQPVQKERKGHPILLGKKSIDLILNSSKESTLKIISSSNEIKKRYWECDFPNIFIDIDTDVDYQNLFTRKLNME